MLFIFHNAVKNFGIFLFFCGLCQVDNKNELDITTR